MEAIFTSGGRELPLSIEINPIVSLIAHFAVCYGTLTKRRSLAVHIGVVAIATALVFVEFAIPFRSAPAGAVIRYLSSLFLIFPVMYLFEESFAEKFFVFFMGMGGISFVWSLCDRIDFLPEPEGSSLMMRSAFLLCCYVVVITLYYKYWRHRIKMMLSLFNKGSPAYAVFPFIAFILFAAIFGPANEPTSWYWFVLMLLFESLVILMYYILFSHLFMIYSKQEVEEGRRHAERQLLQQKKYYEEMGKGISEQGKLLHDARHHFVTIASLAEAGDPSAIAKYIGRLLDTYGSSNMRRYCENGVADAVIGGYIEKAEKLGIMVTVELDLPQRIGIDEYELCALFGNTIENAMEACQRIPADSAPYAKRYIRIESKAEKGSLVVRIENSCHGELANDEGRFPSSKGAMGGIGLESVRAVVEKYEGRLSCTSNGDTFAFAAELFPRPMP